MANEVRLIDANALKGDFVFLRKMWSGAEIAAVIDEAPTVDAVPVVHGRWIYHNKGLNNWVECSRCNTVGSPFWKCCPVCEARMDGDGHEN